MKEGSRVVAILAYTTKMHGVGGWRDDDFSPDG
jgi:hypothetical protein